MKYKERLAIIREDNLPYCSECGSILGNMKDHSLVEHEGEKYFEFKRFCSNSKCSNIGVYFQSDLGGERFIINNVKEIKEEEIKELDYER